MQVDLVDSTDQSITCCITYDSHKFFLNAIYGCNDGMDRKRLWSYLYSLHSSLSQDPWMLVVDFKVTTRPSESSNYNDFQVANIIMINIHNNYIYISLIDK